MGMRPLFHPSLEDITVEGILHALADPIRAAIYVDIVAQECSHHCSMFLTVSDKTIPKSTLSQHFRALREAGAGLRRPPRRGEGGTSPACAAARRPPPLGRAAVRR